MPGDFLKPTTVRNYSTEFTQDIQAIVADLAKGLDATGTVNTPVGAIRFTAATKRWEKWSGTVWGELIPLATDKYSINVERVDGYDAGNASGNVPVSNGTLNTNLNADLLDGLHESQIDGNWGNRAGNTTYSDFNTPTRWGGNFINGTLNGPAIPSANHYYAWKLSLGSDFSSSSYAMDMSLPRTPTGGSPYMSVRFREAGIWGAWQKIYAGYADSAGDSATLGGLARAGFLEKSGGAMTGALTLAADGSAALHPASKQQLDAVSAVANAALPKAGGTMTGAITLPGNPGAALQATPKQYIDAFFPVAQWNIASLAVGQAQIRSTQWVVSSTSNTGMVRAVSAAGQYGFQPTVETTNTGGNLVEMWAAPGIWTIDAPYGGGGQETVNASAITIVDGQSEAAIVSYWILAGIGGAGETGYVRQRYIQSSPPYDLGDGAVPLFIFGLVNRTTGEIGSVWTAQDPPWANNGPTNIRPDFIAPDGRKFKRMLPRGGDAVARFKAGQLSANDLAAALALYTRDERECDWVEITQAMKQADMPLIPHPFLSLDSSRHEVVLFEPTGAVVQTLGALHDAGEDANGLLHDGYIQIGNQHIGCKAPPGVMAVRAAWRDTKRSTK